MKTVSCQTFALLLMSTAETWAQQEPIMAVTATIGSPVAVITDANGNLYFSTDGDLSGFDDSRVFKVDRSGVLTVVAGNSVDGYSGDGGPAVNAQLNHPGGLAFDKAGNLYIADSWNYCVRKVTPAGVITTAAGIGTGGYSGDGGPATNAQFYAPQDVAFDGAGNLYVADVFFSQGVSPSSAMYADGWVRKVSPNGIISTVAGSGCPPCTGSMPAIGTSAKAIPLSWVRGVAVDSAANLYISNYQYGRLPPAGNDYVFEVSPSGLFVADFRGGFTVPTGIAFDGAGSLYVADTGNNRVRKVTAAGIVTTVAGSGAQGYSGDGGLAVQADLNQPTGIAFDSGGNLYIADWGNQRIRKVSSGGGNISTAAGGGSVSVPSTGPPAISNVVNGASFQQGVVSNSWITIQGTNLSPTTDTWANAILNGKLPTSLGAVSVNVSGLPAYIYYVSPNQINAIAPNIDTSGFPVGVNVTLSVTVSTPKGTSTVFSAFPARVTLQSMTFWVQPAFFLWPGGYAVATKQDYSWAVKNGTFPGTATVAAKPGDVVTLWGTGFGPTSPTAPVGVQIPTGTIYNTTNPVTATVGGRTAVVYGAALAPGYAGLYQVAIQVPPSLTDGDYPVIAIIDGAASPSTTLITVQH